MVVLLAAAVVADAASLLAPNVGVSGGAVDMLVAAPVHLRSTAVSALIRGPLRLLAFKVLGLPLSEDSEAGRGGGGREGWGDKWASERPIRHTLSRVGILASAVMIGGGVSRRRLASD